MSEYTVRKITADEFHLLIPLMQNCFGNTAPIEYFEWKFLKNPAGFVEGFAAFTEKGEIVAFYDVIPEEYIMNGEKLTIYQACDGMTHSGHRRKGLFQKIVNACYDHLHTKERLFLIGFGGDKSTQGLIKLGWKQIFRVRYYFYPRAFLPFTSKINEKNITEITDPNSISQLILKSNENSVCHSHKTPVVFKWRTSNPLYQYKLIAHKNQTTDNNCSSYLCYYETADKIMLFDHYFADLAGGKALTGYLKNKLRGTKLKGIIAFCQEDSRNSADLKKLGFISNPLNKGPLSYKASFITYTRDAQMMEFANAAHWQINAFEHDAM